MIISCVRTVILYAAVILAMRLMGKRQIGELQPFELVVTLMLSDLAAVPMQETGIPLLSGLVPIASLVILEVTLSFISLKNKRARAFLLGRPAILVRDGKLCETEMRRLRINVDDIQDELRKKDIMSIAEVEIAIVETDGSISAFPKAGGEKLPYTLISDGRILSANLKKSGIGRAELLKMLGDTRPEEVLVATYTKENGLSYQKKGTK